MLSNPPAMPISVAHFEFYSADGGTIRSSGDRSWSSDRHRFNLQSSGSRATTRHRGMVTCGEVGSDFERNAYEISVAVTARYFEFIYTARVSQRHLRSFLF